MRTIAGQGPWGGVIRSACAVRAAGPARSRPAVETINRWPGS